ncbi:EIIABC-Fru [Alloiococcus otitis]|uniref:PTS system, Fru family, IIC component n=1 Tax=Alloiococcus otitis ATCC 51267 TaxID=883081 RepID=K9ECK5_9LACT|nr:PTS fructose transporter subunit IIABC [Alloiococcus otitis]EKU93586.1 PTS system, Fru family, IIC component [Alloiococcus otitis ATCC 51267]SUU80363.1 EIIABC-Fru [Alloiococcus otitis]
MQLSELFSPAFMDLNLQADSKQEALENLVKLLHQEGKISQPDKFLEALMNRESQSTTGVGDEIAIPHAQDEDLAVPVIVFARVQSGLDWEAMDGQPAKLIFLIAAPKDGNNAHLSALAKLSGVLMKEGVKAQLLQATSPDQVLSVFKAYEEDPKDSQETESDDTGQAGLKDQDPNEKQPEIDPSSQKEPYILAVTACPTGIAHTFMAEEKLKETAKKRNINIKVETNGQNGVNNRLTKQDIEDARAIIVAADKQVDMARFDGKPVLIRKVADGINKPDELLDKAINQDAKIYHAGKNERSDEDQGGDESLGRRFYKHLMNGVSHMLPFIVAGGLLIAISFFWGINAAGSASPDFNANAHFINSLGNMAFAMMLPMLAGFIGQSMADRPGLVVGFMGGIFADPEILSAFGQEGYFENFQGSGFLGALVAGFLAGGIIYFLRWAFSWLPKSLDGLKPIFIFPILGVLLMGGLMFFVINSPMAWVMDGLINFINSIPREYSILLGFVVAAMMAIDMGGPINKAAYVTGTALLTTSAGSGSDIMAAVMIGGMVPPLAIAVSALINKNLWPDQQRKSAYVNIVMGASFITEGAIPFAASNPLRVIPPLAVSSGLAGALSMFFGSASQVPHGGLFAVVAGGVSSPLFYTLSWLVAGILGGFLLNLTMKKRG